MVDLALVVGVGAEAVDGDEDVQGGARRVVGGELAGPDALGDQVGQVPCG
ncbi:hypothetical protein ACU686_21905 [Yinghuangia aomiensis]